VLTLDFVKFSAHAVSAHFLQIVHQPLKKVAVSLLTNPLHKSALGIFLQLKVVLI